jgi:hypothetical protein
VDPLLLPDDALDILRGAVWNPQAERFYEVMSGAFWWTDELVREASRACMAKGNWAFRYLMGYRASLIRGAPDDRLRPAWDQVRRECPTWPGLRPERSGPGLAKEMDREGRRQCVAFRRWGREFMAGREAADHPSAPEAGRDGG